MMHDYQISNALNLWSVHTNRVHGDVQNDTCVHVSRGHQHGREHEYCLPYRPLVGKCIGLATYGPSIVTICDRQQSTCRLCAAKKKRKIDSLIISLSGWHSCKKRWMHRQNYKPITWKYVLQNSLLTRVSKVWAYYWRSRRLLIRK